MTALKKKKNQGSIVKESWAFSSIGLIVVIVIAGALSLSRNDDKLRSDAIESDAAKVQEAAVDVYTCILDECLDVPGLEYPVSVLRNSVESALKLALEDEYRIRAIYAIAIETHGSKRPFITVLRSQEIRIQTLLSLFDKYSVKIPEDTWKNKVLVPATMEEACMMAKSAQAINASLYEEELKPLVKSHDDIDRVFDEMLNVSRNKYFDEFRSCDGV